MSVGVAGCNMVPLRAMRGIMRLKGSCSCGAVKFSLDSHTPYPYMRCYCSICRKTQGGGGYAINIMGETKSFKLTGEKNVSVYRARVAEGKGKRKTLSAARRHFCSKCGSALWLWDPRWAEWVYPFASAIDTPLRTPRLPGSPVMLIMPLSACTMRSRAARSLYGPVWPKPDTEQ